MVYVLENIDFCMESLSDAVRITNIARDYGVILTMVQESGPGGGNPMMTAKAASINALDNWLVREYCKETQCEIEYFRNLIKIVY